MPKDKTARYHLTTASGTTMHANRLPLLAARMVSLLPAATVTLFHHDKQIAQGTRDEILELIDSRTLAAV